MRLRVAICQMDIVWGDCEANLQRVESYVCSADADMVVFPEMFLTGYDCSSEIALPTDSPFIGRVQIIAQEAGRAVAGTIAVNDNGAIYNRFYLFRPDGTAEYYDKRHLFRMAGEDKVFSAGTERVVVEFMGWRILLQVCYDLRFPVWSRQRGDEYDLVIYSAEWAEARVGAWDRLLPARAIENQSFVVGVNRVGDDHTAHYSGHSVVLNPYGEVVVRVDDDKEGVAVAELDLEQLRRFREKFPSWRDADNFMITN